jgi:hypothetical protein
MKVVIEFDGIEERNDLNDALNGYKWKMIVWDMDQELRRYIKYDDKLNDQAQEIVEKLREYLRDTINEHGVNIYD